jgi:hypothetical protein
MSKAHEEGGDLMSSERLASAFMTLGIATTSEDEAEAEIEVEPNTNNTTDDHETENDPLTYKAALRSPQANEWREAMR